MSIFEQMIAVLQSILRWIGAALSDCGAVLKSLLTGPDGESYAPGRIMALVLFGVVCWLVVFIADRLAAKSASVSDWVTYLNALMIFVPAMCVAIIGLILGQAPTDAGGKWWGKDASPPPPVPLEEHVPGTRQ